MEAIVASSPSARVSLTATLAQRQAERAAQQAEARAQALQAESVRARREADRANERAQTLERQAAQADSEAARTRSDRAAWEGYRQLAERFSALRIGPTDAVGSGAAPESVVPASSQSVAAEVGTAGSASVGPSLRAVVASAYRNAATTGDLGAGLQVIA